MNIFDQVKSVDLPLGQYAVVGSGAMAARGIRDYKDIDILVTPILYRKLILSGWKEKKIRLDFTVVKNGIFEASPDMMTLSFYKPRVDLLIKNAEVINNLAFINLSDLIYFKRAIARPKDMEDIKLIEKYLAENSK